MRHEWNSLIEWWEFFPTGVRKDDWTFLYMLWWTEKLFYMDRAWICSTYGIDSSRFEGFVSEFRSANRWADFEFKSIGDAKGEMTLLYCIDFVSFVAKLENPDAGLELMRDCKDLLLKIDEEPRFLELLMLQTVRMLELEVENGLQKRQKPGHIYLIESQWLYKIWRTQDMDSRYKRYVTENPNPVTLIYHYRVSDYESEEKRLHNKFRSKRHRGEWFALDEKDIRYISSIKEVKSREKTTFVKRVRNLHKPGTAIFDPKKIGITFA